METITRTSYENFKIKAYLNNGGDVNRFHFACCWIVDHCTNTSTWIDVSLHPEQSFDRHQRNGTGRLKRMVNVLVTVFVFM